jgi:hypothetical protein
MSEERVQKLPGFKVLEVLFCNFKPFSGLFQLFLADLKIVICSL